MTKKSKLNSEPEVTKNSGIFLKGDLDELIEAGMGQEYGGIQEIVQIE